MCIRDRLTYDNINNASGNEVYGDNESVWSGFEWDNHRVAWQTNSQFDESEVRPQQDRRASLPALFAFGSAHNISMNMSYCDGSVRQLAYDVDSLVHRRAANRNDSFQEIDSDGAR